MGGGGTTGEVIFPDYVMDTHCQMLIGEFTRDNGTVKYDGPTEGWDVNDVTLVEIMNTLWSSNIYTSLVTTGWTDPATDLAANAAQYALFKAGVTAYSRDNYADYISDAILAIGNSTTVPIANLATGLSTTAITAPTTSYTPLVDVGRTQAAANLTSMFAAVQPDVRLLMADAPSTAIAAVSLTAATTMWDSLVDTVSTKLQTCGIPKNANLLTVLTKAAQDAEQNLRSALTLTKRFIDNDLIGDLSNEFAARREITFSSQHRRYAGQMADLNAINSTGFLFGTALLKAEQMREVGEFDTNLSMSQFQQGLAAYMQMHGQALTAGLAIEQQNAQAHNRLLETSIQLLTSLNTRGEILPSDLVRLYGQFFAQELGMFDNSIRDATRIGANLFNTEGSLFGVTSGDQLRRDGILAQLTLEADRINKLAFEQRFQIGMVDVQQLLTNRLQFEQVATQVITEQNRIKIVATDDYDTGIAETRINETWFPMDVMRQGGDILVAPGGMSAAIPTKPSKGGSAIGGAMEGAALGASIGIAGGPAAPFTATAGAIGGAIVGGIGGLFN